MTPSRICDPIITEIQKTKTTLGKKSTGPLSEIGKNVEEGSKDFHKDKP